MAVRRLCGAWVLHVLGSYPDGVQRRQLLDLFAAELVSPRSRGGAKGRVAMKLYRILERLQRKGLIAAEDGLITLGSSGQGDGPKAAKEEPLLSAPLRRALFQALLAEDRDSGLGQRVVSARLQFILQALGEGWTAHEMARSLGASPQWVAQVIVGLRPERDLHM